MDDYLSIRIKRNDLGQIVDGLQVLLEEWQATRAYFHDENTPQDGIIRECNDLEEAEWMCTRYEEIVGVLEKSLAESRKAGHK